jgi:N-acetylated-alpha-linked acidic dipeptidase
MMRGKTYSASSVVMMLSAVVTAILLASIGTMIAVRKTTLLSTTDTATATVTVTMAIPIVGATKDDPSPFSDMEQIYLGVPDATSARSNLHFITRVPHVAGTPGDHVMANFVVNQFIQAGIPNVSTYDLTAFLNYPKSPPTLELYEPKSEQEQEVDDVVVMTTSSSSSSSSSTIQNHHSPSHRLIYKATLSEDLLDDSIDETTDTDWRNHTFHGYSASGTIHGAHLIYANYGRPQDFDLLESIGISVRDRIVLVRYGLCFRGLKVRNAEQRGAVGVLIYSDPADDGYGKGLTYPNGPWRPESSIQRGSVQYNSRCAGDPRRADPRYSTILNTTVQELCGVLSPHEMVPRIPSLPLNYRDALPLLQNLGGPVAADVPGGVDFVGGFTNLTYRIGPSRGVLNMIVNNEDVNATIPNVVGVIPGTLPPDKDMPILLGNHRDAWYVSTTKVKLLELVEKTVIGGLPI